MDDPLLDELLAEAESLLAESELTVRQATELVLSEDRDLESEREDRLRQALISELDRRRVTAARDLEESAWAEEEWSDRGDLPEDPRL